ncbi:MAG: DNA-binding transcriptional regulator [Thermoguttaceae bacterium]|jgi:LacI family transcriptional regulator
MNMPRIALLIEVTSAHARGLIRGVSAFAQARGPWKLQLVEQLRISEVRRWLAAWQGDGVIARVGTETIAEALRGRDLPVVNVTGTTSFAGWPRVDTDNQAVCQLAATHLVDCGYANFAYCGMPQYEWSGWRKAMFAQELARRSIPVTSFDLPSLTADAAASLSDRRKLEEWVVTLPKPVGILAANDHCGRSLLEACDAAGLAVPNEIGVIGVDNDELVCELCQPPLSSIEANCERIGYVAAETLAQTLQGRTAPAQEMLIKPTTLVPRLSTDLAAVREPIVGEALRFIRAYGCEEIGVGEVTAHVGVSRRYLEQSFRRAIDRSIHTEILRVRLEKAQRLLGETDLKLQTIAERCGFKRAAYLSAVFQEKLGLRPGDYRRRMQQ